MQAIAVFPKERDVRLIDAPPSELKRPTDVRVRILEVGVCGTDRELVSFEYGSPPAGENHLVIGHEALGVVVEVGTDVTRVRVGDLVVPMVRRPCTHVRCRPCQAERADFCSTGDFTERGIKGRHGFLTPFIVDEEAYMNVVPPGLRDVGVLTEPLTIAEKALSQLWRIQSRVPAWTQGNERGDGLRALVLGAGPVGLLGALALSDAGFDPHVYSGESASHPKARLVAKAGLKYVSAEEASVRDIKERVGVLDVVYEATGASVLAFEVLHELGPNGVFVFTGVPGRKNRVELDTARLMRDLVLKNQLVVGSVNASRSDYERAIRTLGALTQRLPHVVESLVTARTPYEQFSKPLLGPPQGIKDVLVLPA